MFVETMLPTNIILKKPRSAEQVFMESYLYSRVSEDLLGVVPGVTPDSVTALDKIGIMTEYQLLGALLVLKEPGMNTNTVGENFKIMLTDAGIIENTANRIADAVLLKADRIGLLMMPIILGGGRKSRKVTRKPRKTKHKARKSCRSA